MNLVRYNLFPTTDNTVDLAALDDEEESYSLKTQPPVKVKIEPGYEFAYKHKTPTDTPQTFVPSPEDLTTTTPEEVTSTSSVPKWIDMMRLYSLKYTEFQYTEKMCVSCAYWANKKNGNHY